MDDFENIGKKSGFSMKLWRGERMCLVGFDVDDLEPDLVGFTIGVKAPGSADFSPLANRLAFSYDKPVEAAVDGSRNFPSTQAPFQKFRWIHFPWGDDPKGKFQYRATKMHMPQDNKLVPGTSLTLDIPLDPQAYADFLDVGFTRNFASSQAYADRFGNNPDVIPANADDGLDFNPAPFQKQYEWLGFEARQLMLGFLDEFIADKTIALDVFAYDFNEPEILQRLEQYGSRLRIVIDDTKKTAKGKTTGHGVPSSPESQCAKRLAAKGAKVKRTHFKTMQHNKLFIAKKNGTPFKVLTGSTNFSFRGLYIQANNVLVFDDESVAGFYGTDFEQAFNDPGKFSGAPIASKWNAVADSGRPKLSFCFSPHKTDALSLNPLAGAIDQATSSVFYAVAFLNQIKSGPTFGAFKRLIGKPVFSYGVADKQGNLEVHKPDGSIGLVDFEYLAAKAPEPFKSEWSGGKGINIHHKFVVTDFNLETAKVFTGSSNLSHGGETGNGDNLIQIEDRKIATAYAIEAVRVFDHLHFRSVMQDKLGRKKSGKTGAAGAKSKSKSKDGKSGPSPLVLRKPTAISGRPSWFAEYYQDGSQKERDRKLFSS